MQSGLLSLLIQMLTSTSNTLTNQPGIMYDQVFGPRNT